LKTAAFPVELFVPLSEHFSPVASPSGSVSIVTRFIAGMPWGKGAASVRLPGDASRCRPSSSADSAQPPLLGLLAHTIGDTGQAADHFEDTLAFCRDGGYRPELAWACCDYADLLRERGGPGDKEKAVALLDESLAISSELGMRPLMERVLSRRDILKA